MAPCHPQWGALGQVLDSALAIAGTWGGNEGLGLCLRLTGFAHHGGQQLGDDGAPLPHLALLAVGEVGEDARDALGAGRLTRIHHDEQLHDGGVHVPVAHTQKAHVGNSAQ